MTSQFFIRRNEKVKGPMDAEGIRKLIKTKRLKPRDEVSSSVDGPWDQLSRVYKDILSGSYVDSTATKLPQRKSNRKKEKMSKPLDGVECLGTEWHIARMAMYKKYRKHLRIALWAIVLGVPIAWTIGKAYESYGSSFYEGIHGDGGPDNPSAEQMARRRRARERLDEIGRGKARNGEAREKW